MPSLDCLLLLVNLGHKLWIVDLIFNLLESSAVSVDASEVRRTPHLISVELVRTSELVPILLLVDAIVEGIPSLEAQFLVVLVVMEVPHREEAIVCQTHCSNYY